MRSILGQGTMPSFGEERDWKDLADPHVTRGQASNYHPQRLFHTPNGSLHDIFRPVQRLENSPFIGIMNTSGTSEQPSSGAHQHRENSQHTALLPNSIIDNWPNVIGDRNPVDGRQRDLELQLQGPGLERQHQQSLATAAWDHGVRTDRLFEGYGSVQCGVAETSSTPLLQPHTEIETLWTPQTSTHDQHWPNLRGELKTTDIPESGEGDNYGNTELASRPEGSWSGSLRIVSEKPASAPAVLKDSTDGGASDPLEDLIPSQRWSGTSGFCSSRNLFSERKRRKKMNDGLYSLRALVPNISKMDKASIIRDAIKYVVDLERQVKEMEAEIERDEKNHNTMKTSLDQLGSSSSAVAVPNYQQREENSNEDDTLSEKTPSSSGTIHNSDLTKDETNITLEISKMKTGIYSIRMYYAFQPGHS